MAYYLNYHGAGLFSVDDWDSGELAEGSFGPFESMRQVCVFFISKFGDAPFHAPDADALMEYLDTLVSIDAVGSKNVCIVPMARYINVYIGHYCALAPRHYDQDVLRLLTENNYIIE